MSFLQNTAGTFYAITQSDTLDQSPIINAIHVGGAGDVKVTGVDGVTVVFKAMAAGSILPVKARRVWSTGTSATDLIALVGK